MKASMYAGFEGALLPWNGHDTLISTGHFPQSRMAQHYRDAVAKGAQGFRDTMPERMNKLGRWSCARGVTTLPIVWSLIHFDRPQSPMDHAFQCAHTLRSRNDKVIAFNEPSMTHVHGVPVEQAVGTAIGMMGAAGAVHKWLKFWTCDPVHHLNEQEWWATDRMVECARDRIEVVGINYHACWAEAPLHRVLMEAQTRYPGHRIAITETSWHEGLPDCHKRFPNVHNRQEWWEHVALEVYNSGIPVHSVCWAPFVDMAWEAGPAWPNGWPF